VLPRLVIAAVTSVLLLVSTAAQADYLEVRRKATLKDGPSRDHDILERLEEGVLLELVSDSQQHGYYHVTKPGGLSGFIYRTLVRRHRGRIPASLAGPPDEVPAYNRSRWRHWIDADRDCQDTRQEVLIEESQVPVTYEDAESCRVKSDRWLDPYSGELITDPGKLDVDHLVPLKNAYLSGGWAWDTTRRKAYANDLGAAEHLIAVKASLNRQKGSKGPDVWKPPVEAYWCGYAKAWKAIKDKWNLTMTDAESAAVAEMQQRCQ
jgi:hypothetical protein